MLNCCDGDEGAFEILYRRYEKPILSFIYRMIMSAADAEDLCQETFFKVFRARKSYRPDGKFKTWLFRIALNLCRDRIRRMKFRSHEPLDGAVISRDGQDAQPGRSCDHASDPAKHAEAEEMKALVQQALAALPEEQRTVIVLRQYHSLTFSEIAEVTECPIGTAKSLSYRGHQKLFELLSGYID